MPSKKVSERTISKFIGGSLVNVKNLVVASVFLGLVTYGIELVIYPGVIQNYLGVSAHLFVLPSLVALTIYRIVFRKRFSITIQSISLRLLPLIVGACVGIQVINQFIHPNFFFSTFHFHPAVLESIALYVSGVALFIFDRKFLRQNKNLFMHVLPFWLLCLTAYLKWNFPSEYADLRKEDSVIEYLTFLAYIIIGVYAFRLLLFMRSRSYTVVGWRSVYTITLFILMLTSFIIAGEEISWAQRLLGFETHEFVAANNRQDEFNLHNQDFIFRYIHFAYAGLAAFGLLAWAIALLSEKFNFPKSIVIMLKFISPSWRLAWWFIPMIIYVYLRERFGDEMFYPWEELVELYLVIGLLFFVVDKFKEVKKDYKKLPLPGLQRK